MGNAVTSIVETVQNDIGNTVDSVVDFVHAPAATLTEAWVQQSDQEYDHQVGVLAPVVAFVQGDLSLGEALEGSSKAGVNADLALITGKEDNNENATIVRNTVASVAAVAAIAYGGVLAASGGGLGTAGASVGAAGTVGSVGAAEVVGTSVAAAEVAGGGITMASVGTALTGATAVVTAGGGLVAAVSPASEPVPVAVPVQSSGDTNMVPYLLAAGIAAKILLF